MVGSRNLWVDISRYIPESMTLLISGGAKGIGSLAERYADLHGIPKRIILPDYEAFGRAAPLICNRHIVECSEVIIAIWDGKSSGIQYTIDYAEGFGKHVILYTIDA